MTDPQNPGTGNVDPRDRQVLIVGYAGVTILLGHVLDQAGFDVTVAPREGSGIDGLAPGRHVPMPPATIEGNELAVRVTFPSGMVSYGDLLVALGRPDCGVTGNSDRVVILPASDDPARRLAAACRLAAALVGAGEIPDALDRFRRSDP